ncbi:MAG: hypothetical protein JXQ73_25560 [Phycisphaerae bacterium]|nr:hypothetical protein [Phycisphaerae bacterium]
MVPRDGFVMEMVGVLLIGGLVLMVGTAGCCTPASEPNDANFVDSNTAGHDEPNTTNGDANEPNQSDGEEPNDANLPDDEDPNLTDPNETDIGPFAGADMDLHFMHPSAPGSATAPDLDRDGLPDPYFDQPYDCYWFNPHPDWGILGGANDPSLDRDDTDGVGPENVNLDAPESGKSYRVAVHYWDDHGHGNSTATVRIYVDGRLVYEAAGVSLTKYDLWCVAYIDWPSGEVRPCEAVGGGPKITPSYKHALFLGG